MNVTDSQKTVRRTASETLTTLFAGRETSKASPSTQVPPDSRQRSFQSQDFEISDPTRKAPQMRPQHHVQPLTNPPGHAQEPHERYRCKTTTKPTAATHQPPATETALEGAQEQVKLLDWEHIFYGHFFHFSDEVVKGARRRRGKPRLDQHMRSNLEAAMRASGRPR